MEDDERLSNAPNVQPHGASPDESSTCSKTNTTNNKEQDRFLPIANVGRIMKKGIPANGKISKDAKETVQECVSEFISFVTGEASDKCQREKRKTINGDDIIWAITTLGFEDYVDPLKLYLAKYRELEGEKLNVPKQQCQQQQQQQTQHQQQNIAIDHHNNPLNLGSVFNPGNVYTPSISNHSSYVSSSSSDHHLQPFLNLPFPTHQNAIPPAAQYTKQEQIDSVGHWQ